MSTEIKCTRFAPGAAVPEWLLAAEPMGPDSVAGPFIFQIEVDVIELEDRFVLLPTGTGNLAPTLHYGGQGARLYAPAKPVCNVLVTNTIMGLEVDAWSEVPQAPPAQQGLSQPTLPALPGPPPSQAYRGLAESEIQFHQRALAAYARAAQEAQQQDAHRRAYQVPGIPADQLGEWPPAPDFCAPGLKTLVKPRGFWRRLWDAIANA